MLKLFSDETSSKRWLVLDERVNSKNLFIVESSISLKGAVMFIHTMGIVYRAGCLADRQYVQELLREYERAVVFRART
ncbi:hypothetical protein OK016_02050 [Vibrio chagasii]|nr:hypothetical protein [Vibrio chagasii]